LYSLIPLLALVFLSTSAEPNKGLYWFSTKSPLSDYTVDFRGCYGPECVYVASRPLPNRLSNNLGLYSSQTMWAVGYSGDLVEYVFSEERPAELSSFTLWMTPVAEQRVLPAEFRFNTSKAFEDPDPHVAEFISRLDSDSIRALVEHLAAYNSRNSVSPDTPKAADWAKTLMTSSGCQNAQLMTFRSGWAPNVICEIPGTNPNALPVVVGAHYDSRSTNVNSPTQRAPGADDNGSGSAGLLEILTTATDLIREEGYSFESKIIFVLFAGEEQGLVGSAALASSYVNQGLDLLAMVNMDMIAYPDRANPQTLYWMSGSTTPALTDLAFQLTKTYLGDATLLARTGACCSDQQSFYSRGYPAASVFESRSAGNNPNYHQSSDLPPTLNYQHLLRNVQSAAALITTLAKIDGPLK